VRVRLVFVLLAAFAAVLLVGAVVSAEVAERTGDASPCHTDVRCSGQSVTTATGPLTTPDAWPSGAPLAVLVALVPCGVALVLHDRLSASRLFRPPRLGV
jgi:hypothetical protein